MREHLQIVTAERINSKTWSDGVGRCFLFFFSFFFFFLFFHFWLSSFERSCGMQDLVSPVQNRYFDPLVSLATGEQKKRGEGERKREQKYTYDTPGR